MSKAIKGDFHNHILPGIDDGAKDCDTSVKMLSSLINQGVDLVCFTPHYTPHREELDHFLERRNASFQKLKEKVSQTSGITSFPRVKMGAEVYIEPDLIHEENIRKLCYTGTNALLLEFPFGKLERRVYEAVENITLKYDVIPVIAHLDRYRSFFTKDQMERVLGLPNVIIQINAEAFDSMSGRRFAVSLIQQGLPVILGSDGHNMERRPPKIEKAYKVLESKLKERELARFYRATELVLGENKE